MKISSGKVHSIFHCHTCGLEWQDFKNARKNAYSHAKNKGHRVTGEVGFYYHYN